MPSDGSAQQGAAADDTEDWIATLGVVPEPSTALLLASALAALAVGRRRKGL